MLEERTRQMIIYGRRYHLFPTPAGLVILTQTVFSELDYGLRSGMLEFREKAGGLIPSQPWPSWSTISG